MKTRKSLILLLASLLITACSSPANKPNSKPTELKQASESRTIFSTKSADVNDYLAFAEEYANLSPEAQKQTLNATNQQLATNANDLLQRFKLAMIYALPSSTLQDGQKAQNLLLSILQENQLTNTQNAYAHVLFDYVMALNKASKSGREDEKRIDTILQKNDNLQNKLDSTQQKLASTQQKLEATQQKLEAAQQKIDELKNIEKSMGQREVSPKK
ncbi:MAG TPA: hypothetical protein PL131_00295 [Methylotenera sp.]|nr:hypothetical protein [Methylotenera sp.]HPH04285.1 hypothetical protein [Methylotenera sp.]HPM99839.1 hypothetical protein [Methylotenera sp.]